MVVVMFVVVVVVCEVCGSVVFVVGLIVSSVSSSIMERACVPVFLCGLSWLLRVW